MKKLFIILVTMLSIAVTPAQTAITVEDEIEVNNGLVVHEDTVQLGGAIHKNTVIDVLSDFFAIYSNSDSAGIYIYRDGISYGLMLGNVFTQQGINYNDLAINVFNEHEINLVTDNLGIRNSTMESLLEVEDSMIVIKPDVLFIEEIPVFNSDSDAASGGLTSTRVYVTSDGYLKLKQ